MRWRCKDCRYVKHFTRPVPLEAAGRCPRCKSTELNLFCEAKVRNHGNVWLCAVIRVVAYHLFSALPCKVLQSTTSKVVPTSPQPIKSWPASAIAYSVSSSPCCECFRTVARTARPLCMLSTYTSAKLEFPSQPPGTTRIRAQLERSPDCTSASGCCFSVALWQPVSAARAVAANKIVLTLRWFCDPGQLRSAL